MGSDSGVGRGDEGVDGGGDGDGVGGGDVHEVLEVGVGRGGSNSVAMVVGGARALLVPRDVLGESTLSASADDGKKLERDDARVAETMAAAWLALAMALSTSSR